MGLFGGYGGGGGGFGGYLLSQNLNSPKEENLNHIQSKFISYSYLAL